MAGPAGDDEHRGLILLEVAAAAEAVGVSRQVVSNWGRRGLLTRYPPAPGSVRGHRYDLEQLYRVHATRRTVTRRVDDLAPGLFL